MDPRRRFRAPRAFASAVGAPRLRRPTDVLLVVLGLLALVPLVLVAPGPTHLDAEVSRMLRELTGAWELLWSLAHAGLVIWALLLVLAALLARGRRRLVLEWLLAGALAAGSAGLLAWSAGHPASPALAVADGRVAPETFVSVRLALATAVVAAASPFLVRPLRVAGRSLLLLGAVAWVGSGVAYPAGVAAALLIGVVAGAAVHLLLGSPESRLTGDQVAEGLAGLGLTLTAVDPRAARTPGVAEYDAVAADGRRVLVEVYGRDAWDNQFLVSIWNALVRRGERPRLGRSRHDQAEHAALATLLAQRAGVATPPVVVVGDTTDGDAVLVTEVVGTPLAAAPPEALERVDLASGWRALGSLHAAGMVHGRIDARRVLVLDDEPALALSDLAGADLATTEDARTTDQARLLVATAMAAGTDRAVAAALSVLGTGGMTEVLPYLQRAALDRATRKAVRAGSWDLAELRSAAAAAAGVEPPALEKLQRVTVRSAVIAVAGTALAVLLASRLLDVDYASIVEELSAARWWLLALALLLAPTVQLASSFSTLGATAKELRYGPVLMFQYAVQFVAVAIPTAAGRLALEVRFFQRFGVKAPIALLIGMLDSFAGFVVQVLFLLLIGLTALPGLTEPIRGGADGSAGSDGGSIATFVVLLVVGVLVAAVVTLAVPASRRRVRALLPRAKEAVASHAVAAQEALAVVRRPAKIGQLLGGNVAEQLIQAVILSVCLAAFDVHVHLSQLVLVNVLVSLFAGVMPVPGGIGVTEAAYIVGLQAVGVPSAVAVSAALAYRLATFYLAALWGAAAMRWLRRHEYV
ncbi:flippase-like domain-containing protein [Cellulomonas sp. DKR-3]|uniref:Flippase-like domain-containing protein n=1 Tax=Cellulomonas fulva TaxID=2835530 RepID=A0ABS5TZY1_9CELL|nr:flippase-like domain-containing protein [Cellulomonas fulva]MBT0994698.1 flippase-like domain-containing protein [Cellulomonas fulva]